MALRSFASLQPSHRLLRLGCEKYRLIIEHMGVNTRASRAAQLPSSKFWVWNLFGILDLGFGISADRGQRSYSVLVKRMLPLGRTTRLSRNFPRCHRTGDGTVAEVKA